MVLAVKSAGIILLITRSKSISLLVITIGEHRWYVIVTASDRSMTYVCVHARLLGLFPQVHVGGSALTRDLTHDVCALYIYDIAAWPQLRHTLLLLDVSKRCVAAIVAGVNDISSSMQQCTSSHTIMPQTL